MKLHQKQGQEPTQNSRFHSLASRIKNLFTETDDTVILEEKKTDDDDFYTIVQPFFSRIKTIFTSSAEEKLPENPHAIDVDINLNLLKELFSKHKTLLLLLFVVGLQFIPNYGYLPWGGLWMRLQTQNLPILDDFAQNSVYNFYRSQVADTINKQYPQLPEEQKNTLITDELTNVLEQNKAAVAEQTRQTVEFLKDNYRYEENGFKYTFMPDIDPYQYLRLARNYATHGRLGDDVQNGVSWDTKVIAPLGRDSRGDKELHPYLLAHLYKIISLFSPQMPIMQATAYFPIVFVTITVILTFLFIKKLTNPLGGFFAALFIGIHAAAVGRTQWGHADTDVYNLLFPILIAWLFTETLEQEHPRKKYALAILTTAATCLYAFAWAGWWHIFNLVLASLFIQILYVFIFNRIHLKQTLIIFSIYLVGNAIFFNILREGSTKIILAILEPFTFGLIKAAVNQGTYLFPNVYTTVAELNPTSFSDATNVIGGMPLLITCIIGIILLAFNPHLPRRNRATYVPFFMSWILVSMYATTKGIRFGILTTPITATLFGLCAGMLYQKITKINRQTLRVKNIIVVPIILFLFTFLIINSGQVESAYAQSKNDLPIMNKAWWDTLTTIRDHSAPDAIINSWWDFGHHFKYVAERAVTFDGAHQNSPMAHWIGKVLVTHDEEEAVALLRMLDCGSRTAYDLIAQQKNNDTLQAIPILNELLRKKTVTDAKKYLTALGFKNQEEILSKTHCIPPENYFITSEDMIQKAGVWGHFGLWNFEKAYAWNYLKKRDKNTAIKDIMEKLNYTSLAAEQFYQEVSNIKDEGAANGWISPWPGYLNNDGCTTINTTITCSNGVTINTTNLDTFVRIDKGVARPRSLSYIDEKTLQFTVKQFNDSPTGISVILIPLGDSNYRTVVASPEHAASIFTKLFFLEGHGLKHFKPFSQQHQKISGGTILVWKIDWDGHEQNIMTSLKKTQP